MSLFQKLLNDGASIGHSLVEIDGKHRKPTRKDIIDNMYPLALIRIGKHLYSDKKPLTVGAPEWDKLFPPKLL